MNGLVAEVFKVVGVVEVLESFRGCREVVNGLQHREQLYMKSTKCGADK